MKDAWPSIPSPTPTPLDNPVEGENLRQLRKCTVKTDLLHTDAWGEPIISTIFFRCIYSPRDLTLSLEYCTGMRTGLVISNTWRNTELPWVCKHIYTEQ